MAGAHAISESRRWSTDAHPLEIEYSTAVAEQIRAQAVEGFCRFPRGGVETGGILFGTADGNVVRIQASRPVPCEYAAGPSYVLSEKDEAALRRILEAARTEPELRGMTPVGWYHSHTRSEVFLSPQDLAIQDRYFPGRRQVALVLKPEPFGSARAGFFVREADGGMRTESSYREFTIPVPGRQRAEPPPREPEPESEPEPAAVVEHAPPRVTPPPAIREAQPPARNRSRGRAAVVGLLALIALFAIVRLRGPNAPVEPAPLGLHVTDKNGQLQIAWDRSVVRAKAYLDISEGSGNVRVPFNARMFRAGQVAYARRTHNVKVRLHMDGPGGPREEFVQFLGRPEVPQSEPQPAPRQPPPPRAAPEPAQEAARAEPVKPRPRQFNMARLPSIAAPRRTAAALPAPPSVETSAVVQNAAPVLPPPFAPAPPRPKPAYTGPTSGRIIWTGDLARGASVRIDGRQASSGTVSGELPGVPVRISVHPADLSAHGLTVFTATGRAAREPAGPGNGWNPTVYAVDARRAGELLVLESPGPQNGWKKLAFRNDTRAVPVIVIDWRVAE